MIDPNQPSILGAWPHSRRPTPRPACIIRRRAGLRCRRHRPCRQAFLTRCHGQFRTRCRRLCNSISSTTDPAHPCLPNPVINIASQGTTARSPSFPCKRRSKTISSWSCPETCIILNRRRGCSPHSRRLGCRTPQARRPRTQTTGGGRRVNTPRVCRARGRPRTAPRQEAHHTLRRGSITRDLPLSLPPMLRPEKNTALDQGRVITFHLIIRKTMRRGRVVDYKRKEMANQTKRRNVFCSRILIPPGLWRCKDTAGYADGHLRFTDLTEIFCFGLMEIQQAMYLVSNGQI